MKKLLGELKMSWVSVIIFAILAGAYTGLINQVPFLHGTSFTDIAVTPEWWVIFAVIIVSNCEKPIEAGLKCFVFFLISQPIVYFIQMPFTAQNLFAMYYRNWIIPTVLTLPGGFIAWYIKKDNIVGAIILGIGCSLLGVIGVYGLLNCQKPHILTAIVCLLAIIIFVIHFCHKAQNKIACIAVVLVAIAAFSIYSFTTRNDTSGSSFYELESGHTWECAADNNDNFKAYIVEDYLYVEYTRDNIERRVICIDETGEEIDITVTVKDDNIEFRKK